MAGSFYWEEGTMLEAIDRAISVLTDDCESCPAKETCYAQDDDFAIGSEECLALIIATEEGAA